MPERAPDERARILAIDDDKLLIRSLRRILREHDVTEASGLAEAMDQLSASADFDLILCDLALPDGSGTQMSRRLTEQFPQLADKIVYVTGGPTTEADREFLEAPGVRWVRKPFSMGQLRDLATGAARARPTE